MADAAGEILRRTYRMPVKTLCKTDASPVTEADREVERTLRAMIEKEYPEHGIVGEEFGNVRENAPFQWVLDPIDGTRSFIGGYPIFATLIALAKDGVPILGIIDQPISCERWTGMAGTETRLNSKPVVTRDCKELAQAVIATTSIDYFSSQQLQIFQSLRKQCANCILGGDAYAYAMLASGQIDLVVDAGFKSYDFCALKNVVEGADGVITDWQGKPLTLVSDGRVVAAANPTLHQQALEMLF